MEVESIVVICLITLVILIVQIVVTLRLFLHFHTAHKRDEEQGLQILDTRTGSGSAHEGAEPPLRPEPEALTVPGPVYPASSIYSVQSNNSDLFPGPADRSRSRAPDSWDGTSAAGRRRDLKEFHIGLESEFGAPPYKTARRTKKQDILNEIWARKV
ncbi:hypothetical protein GT037_002853 [Alternaria burnsii]|uniref:Uncharacterized protein n=1 Tax=Alternaria burnsii TaxID=1187904 RepID=A0A8H7EHP8_9PLEO|nr:uncharacterized protein GT037_002853 [Alternaria burnsii]KAF7679105.1 hypothetical protein GT037_002853 [Alternaria burnsii]